MKTNWTNSLKIIDNSFMTNVHVCNAMSTIRQWIMSMSMSWHDYHQDDMKVKYIDIKSLSSAVLSANLLYLTFTKTFVNCDCIRWFFWGKFLLHNVQRIRLNFSGWVSGYNTIRPGLYVTCLGSLVQRVTLETSLICILLSASRDVHFEKRMICFLSGLL